jgi:type VI secretion system protein ImpF
VRDEHEIRVVPSVFDRLVDDAPRDASEAMLSRVDTVREYRRSVQRDLENLLNSRNPFADLAPEFVEVRRSVIAYGLPDFSAVNLGSPHGQDQVRQSIKTTIEFFEPRLTNIVAELLPPTPTDRSLRLRIHARLTMEPSPERVSFDIVMPRHTNKYEVREGD